MSQPPKDETSEIVEDLSQVPFTTLEKLVALVQKPHEIAITLDDGTGTPQTEKMQIRPLNYGQLADAGKIGQEDMKKYRYTLVMMALVNPKPEPEIVFQLPYGFIMDVAREIERISGKTAEVQKKLPK